MARPCLVLDAEQVTKLAAEGLITPEIAAVLGCSEDTLERRFAAALRKGRQERNASLRRWQMWVARQGNATMLIWLGKNLLGQTGETHDVPAAGDVSREAESRPQECDEREPTSRPAVVSRKPA